MSGALGGSETFDYLHGFPPTCGRWMGQLSPLQDPPPLALRSKSVIDFFFPEISKRKHIRKHWAPIQDMQLLSVNNCQGPLWGFVCLSGQEKLAVIIHSPPSLFQLLFLTVHIPPLYIFFLLSTFFVCSRLILSFLYSSSIFNPTLEFLYFVSASFFLSPLSSHFCMQVRHGCEWGGATVWGSRNYKRHND